MTYYHWMILQGEKEQRNKAIDQLKQLFSPQLFQTFDFKNDSFDFTDIQFSTSVRPALTQGMSILDYITSACGIKWMTEYKLIGSNILFLKTDLPTFQEFVRDHQVFKEIPVLG